MFFVLFSGDTESLSAGKTRSRCYLLRIPSVVVLRDIKEQQVVRIYVRYKFKTRRRYNDINRKTKKTGGKYHHKAVFAPEIDTFIYYFSAYTPTLILSFGRISNYSFVFIFTVSGGETLSDGTRLKNKNNKHSYRIAF